MKPGNVFKALSQIKSRMDAVQKELKAARYAGRAGGGAVSVSLTGTGELKELALDPAILTEDADTVSSLVKSAFADAYAQKEKAAAEALKRLGIGAAKPFGAII